MPSRRPPREMLRTLLKQWSPEDRRKFTAEAEDRREEFWQPLRDAGLWDCVSPRERELATTTIATMTAQQQVNASWRIEALQVLMWALGFTAHLPPYDTQASHDLLKEIPLGEMSRLLSYAQLRGQSEIEQARSLAELWHWRSRTRQLIEECAEFPADEEAGTAGFGSFDDIVRFTACRLSEEGRIPPCIDQDFPARAKAYREMSAQEWSNVRSVTVERHFALNWLCGYAPANEWDETTTDT